MDLGDPAGLARKLADALLLAQVEDLTQQGRQQPRKRSGSFQSGKYLVP